MLDEKNINIDSEDDDFGEIREMLNEIQQITSKIHSLPPTLTTYSGNNIRDRLNQLQPENQVVVPDNKHESVIISFVNQSNNPDPVFAKYGDSGFDLRANLEENVVLKPLTMEIIPTGLFVELPFGTELQVRSRSGIAMKHQVFVLNQPGTVDCFSEDMLITTINGFKTINELTIDDVIISLNETTMEFEKDIIEQIYSTGEKDIYEIRTDSGIIELTETTNVLTTNGWKFVKDLTNNDEIIINI